MPAAVYLNFHISCKPWFYTFFYHFLVVIVVNYFMILQQLHDSE